MNKAKVNLVELRDARRDARDHLAGAYADDLIDSDELDRRLEAVENASDPTAVLALYEDVVAPAPGPLVLAESPVSSLATVTDAPSRAGVVAIFAETKRAGSWSPAQTNTVQTIFGNTKLDFREARLHEGTTELRLSLVFGEVEILVPPALPVEVQCTVVFGAVNVGQGVTSAPPSSGGLRLLLTGYVVFGQVGVYERLPGESRREAKKRHKTETKRLKDAGRKALPGDAP